MERFTEVHARMCKAFKPEWLVDRTVISEKYEDKYRYLTFDVTLAKGFCDIYDKVRIVYSDCIGEGFGVQKVEIDNINSTNPQVTFKVWDKEVDNAQSETK